MISYGLDREYGVLYLYPIDRVCPGDFAGLTRSVDAFLASSARGLRGIIIDLQRLREPGRLAGQLQHLRFRDDAQRHIPRVALVSEGDPADAPERAVADSVRYHMPEAEVVLLRGDTTGDTRGEARRCVLEASSDAD